MSDLLWLSYAPMRWSEPFVPVAHGVVRVSDRRIVSGISFVIRDGPRWRRLGVFNRIFVALAARGGKPDQLLIDALSRAKTLLGDKGYDAD